MSLNYIMKLFIYIFLIMSLIIFIQLVGVDLSHIKRLLEVVTVEGLTTQDSLVIVNKSDAFCETHRGSSGALDESCGKLTKNNCSSTSCCVWTSEQKCNAGGVRGPTFNTESNGKTKHMDYYYFQKKCYGSGCPKVV
jgi:hypothetical protein